MMIVTIELKPEIEKRLVKEAGKKGLTIETFIEVFIEDNLAEAEDKPKEKPFHETATPEEWIAELKKWSESHDKTTPFLSDEATRRENIYEDRF